MYVIMDDWCDNSDGGSWLLWILLIGYICDKSIVWDVSDVCEDSSQSIPAVDWIIPISESLSMIISTWEIGKLGTIGE